MKISIRIYINSKGLKISSKDFQSPRPSCDLVTFILINSPNMHVRLEDSVSLFNGISTIVGYLITKSSLLEELQC